VEALGERVDGGLQPCAPHLGRLRLGEVRLRRGGQVRARAAQSLPGRVVEREADAALVVR
jgi:hypothetical protein